jgi:hypothetical protein
MRRIVAAIAAGACCCALTTSATASGRRETASQWAARAEVGCRNLERQYVRAEARMKSMGPTSRWRREQWIWALKVTKNVEYRLFKMLVAIPGPRSALERRAVQAQAFAFQEIFVAYWRFVEGKAAGFRKAMDGYVAERDRADRLFRALGAPHCAMD